jgi:VPDSG-CTERM motif
MKPLKYILLVGALYAGMTSAAHADLTFLGEFNPPNNGAGTELSLFRTESGHSDAVACVQQSPGNTTITNSFGIFTITNLPFNATTGHFQVEVEFTMNPGHVVCGFLTKNGAGNLVFLYSVSEAQGSSGDFILDIPSTGALSHVSVFCCPGGVTTPDGGATVMLLGAGLGALGVVRRYLKR